MGATVGVQDRPRLWPALPAGHLQGVDDELGADVVGDLPADDPPGVGALGVVGTGPTVVSPKGRYPPRPPPDTHRQGLAGRCVRV